IVDAAAFVFVGTDHVQATECRYSLAEPDVCPASGHVRRDSYRVHFARPCNDVGFGFFVNRIKDAMWNVYSIRTKPFGLRNAGRANQNWLASAMGAADFLDQSQFLLSLGAEEDIRVVDADYWSICGYYFHLESVNRTKLFSLRRGGTGHATHLGIKRD